MWVCVCVSVMPRTKRSRGSGDDNDDKSRVQSALLPHEVKFGEMLHKLNTFLIERSHREVPSPRVDIPLRVPEDRKETRELWPPAPAEPFVYMFDVNTYVEHLDWLLFDARPCGDPGSGNHLLVHACDMLRGICHSRLVLEESRSRGVLIPCDRELRQLVDTASLCMEQLGELLHQKDWMPGLGPEVHRAVYRELAKGVQWMHSWMRQSVGVSSPLASGLSIGDSDTDPDEKMTDASPSHALRDPQDISGPFEYQNMWKRLCIIDAHDSVQSILDTRRDKADLLNASLFLPRHRRPMGPVEMKDD